MLDTILLYIVGCLHEQGASAVTMRLVKMLYLLDVEYYRSYGKRVTELEWICYKYGPYAMEFPSIFKRLDLRIPYDEVTTDSGALVRVFHFNDSLDDLSEKLSTSVKLITDRLLKVIGLEDLNVILDYVYFHTEPMRAASFGESLDFARIERRPMDTRIRVEIPPAMAKTLLEEISNTLNSIHTVEVSLPSQRDDAYLKAMEKMDSDQVVPLSHLNGVHLILPSEESDIASLIRD